MKNSQNGLSLNIAWRILHSTENDFVKTLQDNYFSSDDISKYFNQVAPLNIIALQDRHIINLLDQSGINYDAVNQCLSLDVSSPPSEFIAKEEDQFVQYAEQHFWRAIGVVSRGTIRAIDPWNGSLLESTSCVGFVGHPWKEQALFGYRFLGTKIFFVMVTGFDFPRSLAVYVPADELLIFSGNESDSNDLIIAVNNWRSFLLQNSFRAKKYFELSRINTPIYVMQSNHFAHHIWNELSFIDGLLKMDLADRITIFQASSPLGLIQEMFPDYTLNVIYNPCEIEKVYDKMLDMDYLLVPGTRRWIPDDLIQRVINHARRSYPETNQLVNEFARTGSPVLWIGIRTDVRTWISQTDGLIKIVRGLLVFFPNMSVVIDGFSFPEGQKVDSNLIESEYSIAKRISDEFGKSVKFNLTIGMTILQTFLWTQIADFYISPHGTLQHKIGWFRNCAGVVHAPSGLVIDGHATFTARENTVRPEYVFGRVVRDDTYDARDNLFSYEVDWIDIYLIVLRFFNDNF